jgi:hypothetical protein
MKGGLEGGVKGCAKSKQLPVTIIAAHSKVALYEFTTNPNILAIIDGYHAELLEEEFSKENNSLVGIPSA